MFEDPRQNLSTRALELLKTADPEEALSALRAWPRPGAIAALLALLCSPENRIKWAAVTALGALAADLAREDLSAGRELMRRLLWSLNPESGGVGWGAPEALAEIMANHEVLAAEFAPLLISLLMPEGNYLEFPPLLAGAVWGVARLAAVRPELCQGATPYLLPLLEAPDPERRGLAALALGALQSLSARPGLTKLGNDATMIELYRKKKLVLCSIQEIARSALDSISARS